MFSNIKNMLMALITALVGGYIIKQKYSAYKAEDKLKTIETKIAKTNVELAKKTAKAKAESKELEHNTEVEILKELKVEKQKVLKEMDEIEKVITESKANKKVTFEI